MGAQIAAHLTNAGIDTVLFDLPVRATGEETVVMVQGKSDRRILGAAALPLAHFFEPDGSLT